MACAFEQSLPEHVHEDVRNMHSSSAAFRLIQTDHKGINSRRCRMWMRAGNLLSCQRNAHTELYRAVSPSAISVVHHAHRVTLAAAHCLLRSALCLDDTRRELCERDTHTTVGKYNAMQCKDQSEMLNHGKREHRDNCDSISNFGLHMLITNPRARSGVERAVAQTAPNCPTCQGCRRAA